MSYEMVLWTFTTTAGGIYVVIATGETTAATSVKEVSWTN